MPRRPKSSQAKKSLKKKLASLAAGTILAAGSFWVLKSGNHKFVLPTYKAVEVIDGDTFKTKNGQMVRLALLDAPELENCGGQEAKNELEKLIKNKPLYIKVNYVDSFKRLISDVYSTSGLVSEKIVRTGWARMSLKGSPEKKRILAADKYARDNHLGIYNPICLSVEPDKPGCIIKGNIKASHGTKVYSLPGCTTYDRTIVQKDLGDRWFCTETEAKKAGFTRAGTCAKSAKLE